MTVAAQLMAAGANQQLIATQLQKEQAISTPVSKDSDNNVEAPQGTSNDAPEGAVGALSISHEPEGTIEEVTKQVNETNTQEALEVATQELAETQGAATSSSVTDEAEQKFAEQLAAAAPAAGAPMAALPPLDTPAAPLRGAVSMDQWKVRVEEAATEPSLGGTLNATTEQAADDARQAVDDDRNRTLLTHNGSGYVTSQPTFQAPLNATTAPVSSEPDVADILSQSPADAFSSHIDAIQPPAPAVHTPTLAEIDAQNRAHDDALGAVAQAFTTPTPAATPTMPIADGLPPLPPMPDFSTLPPLPADVVPPLAPPAQAQATAPAPVVPADPSQFRIPGQ
jgi:hypothetical protein